MGPSFRGHSCSGPLDSAGAQFLPNGSSLTMQRKETWSGFLEGNKPGKETLKNTSLSKPENMISKKS